MQTAIPCLFMRGGTSRGPFFKASDLPSDLPTRDKVLLSVMGSPDKRQIDGLGGAHPLTSKVGIVSRGSKPGVDLDFLFAQLQPDKDTVDGRGGWVVANDNLGFPAGRKKTILVDLTNSFRPGTPHRVRLRTNLEIYWDSIGYAAGLPATPLKTIRIADASLLRPFECIVTGFLFGVMALVSSKIPVIRNPESTKNMSTPTHPNLGRPHN